ncbi:MAG: hypothetical protein ABW196_03590 [Solirubrobacterales bacterium]
MSPRRIAASRARAIKAALALVAASACLGAVAYAAIRPEDPVAGLGRSKPIDTAPQHGAGAPRGERLLRPRFIEYPESISSLADPQFRFHVPPRSQPPSQPSSGAPSPGPGEPAPSRRFQCRFDDGGWRACGSPYRLSGLVPGGHAFAVRAFNRAGLAGPVASYAWRYSLPAEQGQMDPKPFTIELRGELEDLYPGYPAQQMPVRIANPNPVPIEVTTVTVGISGDPANCPAENFDLTPSSVSPTAPLTVPAAGSVNLPTEKIAAPSISMLNLPVNQDGCLGAEVPLAFAGEAHG